MGCLVRQVIDLPVQRNTIGEDYVPQGYNVDKAPRRSHIYARFNLFGDKPCVKVVRSSSPNT